MLSPLSIVAQKRSISLWTIFAAMTLTQDYLDLLVHPIHKTSLTYQAADNCLLARPNGDSFLIREGVPVLLTEQVPEELSSTAHHSGTGTSFSYKEHYQNDAVAYDYTEESQNPVEKEEIRRLRQTILAQIPKEKGWVLDTGCGGAWLAKSLVPLGYKLISMDISDINPIKALKNVPADNHYGLVADVFELPIRAGSIDCIVAAEIIEHVSDPGRFIHELFNVLKPGGKLIITTPYNELIRTSLCIHCNRLTPHNAHLHSFTEESMKKYLPREAKSVEMKVFNSKLLVKAHLQKAFGFLPLAAWDAVDKMGNALTGKRAYRFMTVISK